VRLVGYPRVSTRGQVKTGASIPYQDREIRAWARRNGHRVVGMFPEEGRSGALDLEDRAALTAAIDLIATGKAEGLICYGLDRLAREITVQEAILAKVWEEAGGQVFTIDHGEVQRDDPDDPMRPPAQSRARRVRRRRGPLRVHYRTEAPRPRPGRAGSRPPYTAGTRRDRASGVWPAVVSPDEGSYPSQPAPGHGLARR
jgi:hypothetical protein